MKARIILSQADFSANNIGKYTELSDYTKKVLAKQTQYTESSEEGIALNDFITALKADGFLGGDNPILKTLVIPALANSHDELLYDIARTDVDGYPINIMPDAAKDAEVKALLPYYSEGRVIGFIRDCTQGRIDSTASNNQSTIETGIFSTPGVAYPPFCAIAYMQGSDYSSDTVFSNNASNYVVVLRNNKLSLEWINQPTKAHIYADITPYVEKGFYGVNYNNNSFDGIIDGATIGSSDVVSAETLVVQTGSNKFKLGQFSYSSTRWFTFSLFAFGNAMTQEQMNKFKGLVDTLMVKLHANIQ